MSNMKAMAEAQIEKAKVESVKHDKKKSDDEAAKTADAAGKAFAAALKSRGPVAVLRPDGLYVTVFSTSTDASGFKSETIPIADDRDVPVVVAPADPTAEPIVDPAKTDVATEPAHVGPQAPTSTKRVPDAYPFDKKDKDK